METRKIELLAKIIEEYIKKACPVGSKFLAQTTGFGLSSATIRNEMAELEKDGYIFQPYPSAGRSPTEKGYQFYLENNLNSFQISEKEKNFLDKITKELLQRYKRDQPILIKELAKKIADLVKEAILVGFSPDEFYYTGLSNVFAQPEFSLQERVVDLSAVIDHLDRTMSKIYNKINKTEVLIGNNNPFGGQCSLIITNLNKITKEIIGILGPMRMDYRKNLNYLNYLKEKLEN